MFVVNEIWNNNITVRKGIYRYIKLLSFLNSPPPDKHYFNTQSNHPLKNQIKHQLNKKVVPLSQTER